MSEQSRSSSEQYKRAFSIADYILKDRSEAHNIAVRVINSYGTLLRELKKNRKTEKHPNWTRVLPNEEFFLDTLTYTLTVQEERRQESAFWKKKHSLDDESMIIRFIKQIVLDGLKRNSRFLNVGLARLIFYYPYAEITEIQQLLEQSSDSLPGEDKFRKHRELLARSLRKRFNDGKPKDRQFLQFEPFNQYEEARIAFRDDSKEYYLLVKECLMRFTPKNPCCPDFPRDISVSQEILEPFYFNAETMSSSYEHEIERNRMHAVVCPGCFGWVLSALHFAELEGQLRLPLFSLNNGGGGANLLRHSSPRNQEPSPSSSSVSAQRAQETAGRSENPLMDKIVIAVDDEPRAYIDLQNPQRIRLALEPGAAFIEARTEEAQGSVPLGLIHLNWDPNHDHENPAQYQLKLRGHCSLEFLISYKWDADGDEESATLMVGCVKAAAA